MQDPRDLKCGDIFYTEEGKFKVDKEVETLFVEEHTGLTFGDALKKLKQGFKVARKGWNGNGMYAVLMPGYPDGVKANETTRKAHGLKDGIVLKVRPYYQLWTAQKDIATWSPSGSDTLAADWEIVGLK